MLTLFRIWYIVILVKPIIPQKSQQFNIVTIENRCPIFYGCVISASNVSSEEKTKLAKLITDNGGKYAPGYY